MAGATLSQAREVCPDLTGTCFSISFNFCYRFSALVIADPRPLTYFSFQHFSLFLS